MTGFHGYFGISWRALLAEILGFNTKTFPCYNQEMKIIIPVEIQSPLLEEIVDTIVYIEGNEEGEKEKDRSLSKQLTKQLKSFKKKHGFFWNF